VTTIGYTPGLRRQDHVRAAQAQFPAFRWYGHRTHLRCYLADLRGHDTLHVDPPTPTQPEWRVFSLDAHSVTASRSPDLATALAELSGKLATYHANVSQAWRTL
jgi:hypothetical protein